MAITAIIFDVDGVIFDSEKIHVRAWEKIFGRMNLVFPRSVYEAGFGVCDREFLLGLKNAGKIPAKADLEALLEEKVHATLSLLEEGVPVFPSVVATIQGLNGRRVLAAASNSDGRFVHGMLRKAGLDRCFQIVLTRKDVAVPKPAPEIYLTCARKLEVAPQCCLVIEDSVVGVTAARAAGMVCLAVTHTTPAEKLAAADFIVDKLSVKEVERVIRRLEDGN